MVVYNARTVMVMMMVMMMMVTRPVSCQVEDGDPYSNLVVVIKEKVQDCSTIRDNAMETLFKASRILREATYGQLAFTKLTFLIPTSLQCGLDLSTSIVPKFPRVQVTIGEDHPVFGGTPWTLQPRGCGAGGRSLYLPYSFLRTSTDYETMGKVVVSEWAKYRWGVFEEYGIKEDPIFPPSYTTEDLPLQDPSSWIPNYCSDMTLEGEFMYNCDYPDCEFEFSSDQFANTSLLAVPTLKSVNYFCNSSTHQDLLPTKHNALCAGRSVEDVIRDHPDFDRPPMPDVGDPTVEYLKYDTRPVGTYLLLVAVTSDMTNQVLPGHWDRLRGAIQQWVMEDLTDDSTIGIVTFYGNVTSVEQNMTKVDNGTRATIANALPENPPLSSNNKDIGIALKDATKLMPDGVIILVTNPDHVQDSTSSIVTAAGSTTVWPVLYAYDTPPVTEADILKFQTLAAATGGRVLKVPNDKYTQTAHSQKIIRHTTSKPSSKYQASTQTPSAISFRAMTTSPIGLSTTAGTTRTSVIPDHPNSPESSKRKSNAGGNATATRISVSANQLRSTGSATVRDTSQQSLKVQVSLTNHLRTILAANLPLSAPTASLQLGEVELTDCKDECTVNLFLPNSVSLTSPPVVAILYSHIRLLYVRVNEDLQDIKPVAVSETSYALSFSQFKLGHNYIRMYFDIGVPAEPSVLEVRAALEESDLRVELWASHDLAFIDLTQLDDPITLHVKVEKGGRPVVGAEVEVEIQGPTTTFKMTLTDTGGGADVTGNDGIYSRYWVAVPEGVAQYTLAVLVSPTTHTRAVGNTPSTPDSGTVCCGSSLQVDSLPKETFNYTIFYLVETADVVGVSPPSLPPAPITDLLGTVWGNLVGLNFTAPGAQRDWGYAYHYNIYWKSEDSSWQQVEDATYSIVEGGSRGHVEFDPPDCDQRFYYLVRAQDWNFQEAQDSNVVSVAIPCDAEPISKPTQDASCPSLAGIICGAFFGGLFAGLLIAALAYYLQQRYRPSCNRKESVHEDRNMSHLEGLSNPAFINQPRDSRTRNNYFIPSIFTHKSKAKKSGTQNSPEPGYENPITPSSPPPATPKDRAPSPPQTLPPLPESLPPLPKSRPPPPQSLPPHPSNRAPAPLPSRAQGEDPHFQDANDTQEPIYDTAYF